MVSIQITHGLVDLNKILKQATIRRNVVIQLICMLKDSGDDDYRHLNMQEVTSRANLLADTDQPTIPKEIITLLEELSDAEEEVRHSAQQDKAAIPAERLWTHNQLERDMSVIRPNLLFPQRDSDVGKSVEASRTNAFAQHAELKLRTGSELLDQFQGGYIPRVFKITFPWRVGGPDLHNRSRLRRSADAPILDLDAFTKMLPRRVEAQLRLDLHLNPAVWSLCFATRVNTGQSLAIRRCLRRNDTDGQDEASIGKAARAICTQLREGKYVLPNGEVKPIDGDTSKLMSAVGLTQTQKALLQNYNFMSARIPGTRQVRRSINHMVFSSRIVYGLPVFMTVTPSDRHSGLMIRLMRYRKNDPAIEVATPTFSPWVGYEMPSLEVSEESDMENAVMDLPDYDLRKLMTAKDPLCSVDAYHVAIRVIVAQLLGVRMCPECPQCHLSAKPCMDRFGSNATAMGGCMGRVDTIIGATEAQKSAGVLHLHFFAYLQMAWQHKSLQEIATMFKQHLLSVEVLKEFTNHVCCASYPDAEQFDSARADIECRWPAYATDRVLSRPPAHVWSSAAKLNEKHLLTTQSASNWNLDAWQKEGQLWAQKNDARLQHVLGHMNHHVHPLVNDKTGERKPLGACQPKGRPKECKHGFPLEAEMTEAGLLVCPCIAKQRGLPTRGPRSRTGTLLPKRNHAWLNAGPPPWMIFSGDNGDIKLPMRVPILPETHEPVTGSTEMCCSSIDELDLAHTA